MHAASKERKASAHPQWLMIEIPISQYASYTAMLCPLQSCISKDQHEKHLCNPMENTEDQSWNMHLVSQYVKATTPQFQQCQTLS